MHEQFKRNCEFGGRSLAHRFKQSYMQLAVKNIIATSLPTFSTSRAFSREDDVIHLSSTLTCKQRHHVPASPWQRPQQLSVSCRLILGCIAALGTSRRCGLLLPMSVVCVLYVRVLSGSLSAVLQDALQLQRKRHA